MDIYQINFEGFLKPKPQMELDGELDYQSVHNFSIDFFYFFIFFCGAQEMDNIQIHFHLKQPFTKSISQFHSLNGRKEWSKIANDCDPFRNDCGGRTGHPDLTTAAVTALISTATLMPTGAVSVVFVTPLSMSVTKIHLCSTILQ